MAPNAKCDAGLGGTGRRACGPVFLAVSLAVILAACNPTVKVEAPDKPIVINMNVKIEQEVRVKVDRDVDTLVQSNPNLF
ncbi:YnbE family lipoprotein [Dongia soli]|uniref:YnbE family lipoprotein n=1 Tax=Dongia soli TaxID=600628 RepID=A0ABU5E835_9PROT|nr:YnbE family lipoprotein [Dongia soli]MDY0882505.1 YnbE family lipoprotein [Dongia soli]